MKTTIYRLEVTLADDTDPSAVGENLLDLLTESPWPLEQDIPGLESFDSVEVIRE